MKNSFKEIIDPLLSKSIKPLSKLLNIAFYSSIFTAILLFTAALANGNDNLYSDNYDIFGLILEAEAAQGLLINLIVTSIIFYLIFLTKNNQELFKKVIKWSLLIYISLTIFGFFMNAFFLERLFGWILLLTSIYLLYNFFKTTGLDEVRKSVKSLNDLNKKIFTVGATTSIIWLITGIYFTINTLNPIYAFFSLNRGVYLFAIWFSCFLYIYLSSENTD